MNGGVMLRSLDPGIATARRTNEPRSRSGASKKCVCGRWRRSSRAKFVQGPSLQKGNVDRAGATRCVRADLPTRAHPSDLNGSHRDWLRSISFCKIDQLLELISAAVARPQMSDATRVHLFRPFGHGEKTIALLAAEKMLLTQALSLARTLEFHRRSSLVGGFSGPGSCTHSVAAMRHTI
jgi:hypothetical protein